MKTRVAFAILGQDRDADKHKTGYRPSVAMTMQKTLPITRLELFHRPQDAELLKTVVNEIRRLSPTTVVRPHSMLHHDRFDFEGVFRELYDFAAKYPFKPEKEEYFVSMATGTHVELICLFMLVKSRHFSGRLLQLKRPETPQEGDIAGTHKIIDLDLSQYDRLMSLTVKEHDAATTFLKSGIATKNKAFNSLIDEIDLVVTARHTPVLRTRSLDEKPGTSTKKGGPPPVLLIGATGVGKSQLARRIYELKKQRELVQGDFIEVNCATLRGDNAMSALFGHKRGAFTGATEPRTGYLRAADGGILFLDEIGELGTDEQAMLLRAIEEKRFQPMGYDTDFGSNFQLIAGTNRDLDTEVLVGKFREDLLARINLWTFRLPSLAERREDIEPNIDYELEEYAKNHHEKVHFNKDARKRFLAFAVAPESLWKANFRDLNAAIVRMATLASGGRITVEIVEREITRLEKQWKKRVNATEKEHLDVLRQYFDEERIDEIDLFDRVQLAETIRVCRLSSTLSEAGRRLFQYSRTQKNSANDASRLRKYLDRFGLNWEIIKEG